MGKSRRARATPAPRSQPRAGAGAATGGDRFLGVRAPVWAVFAWAFVAHLAFFRDDSATAFFFGDGLFFLQKAKALAEGTRVDAGLPYHPPLLPWLLAPLWWTLRPEWVVPASKALMGLANAGTTALLYRLVRDRVAFAAPFALLLPLGFGELLLSATPNSEAIYRLLLAALLVLGWRWPLAGGLVHGLAALARPEHVGLALLLFAWATTQRERRRFAAITAATAAAIVMPYLVSTAIDLRAYDRAHAAELPEPLPIVVPISFYGPLNFALAQREETIFFSRRTLPPTAGTDTLDPLDPVHNRAIVHGYRLGLEEIASRPGRFASRSLAKLAFSLRALVHGWTASDWPKGGEWTRQPVDLASSSSAAYEIVASLLILLGAWSLRGDRALLVAGGALVIYRLAINVLFFPYLRSMAIAAPFTTLLLVAGLATVFGRHRDRLLALVVALLAALHLATAFAPRRYAIAGERDATGSILEDRTVRIRAVE